MGHRAQSCHHCHFRFYHFQLPFSLAMSQSVMYIDVRHRMIKMIKMIEDRRWKVEGDLPQRTFFLVNECLYFIRIISVSGNFLLVMQLLSLKSLFLSINRLILLLLILSFLLLHSVNYSIPFLNKFATWCN